MRFSKIVDLVPGNKLTASVYYPDGRIMLREGVVLTEALLNHLKKLTLNGVYIEDPNLPGVKIDDGIGLDFRLQSTYKLQDAFNEVSKKGTFSIKPILDIATQMVDVLMSKPNFIFQLKDIRSKENYIYSHSINVAALSILTAKALQYNMIQIKEIAVGALLHDIGYAVPNLKYKKDHTTAGFEVLRKQHEVSLKSSHMALQHHENLNGSGFPRGISKKDFIEYAQICAIANDFDNYVNSIEEDNLPHLGIEYIMSKANHEYDSRIIEAFIHNIAPYPVGTNVKLNNGNTGQVIQVNRAYPSRPKVKIDSQEISLYQNMTIFVQEVLV